MNIDKPVSLEDLISQLQGIGMGMSLSKFVELNVLIFKELKKFHVPLKTQAEITSKSINKPVSVSSLAVALSRLNTSSEKNNHYIPVIIMEKFISQRFVDKNAKLVLGTQTFKYPNNKEEKIIDWRGLYSNESISSWVLDYKQQLIGINSTGWRWKQIAEAINEHLNLEKKLSVNTLTSIISISNQKIKASK